MYECSNKYARTGLCQTGPRGQWTLQPQLTEGQLRASLLYMYMYLAQVQMYIYIYIYMCHAQVQT